MYSDTVVELEGVNGEWATLAGPEAGDRGIWLSNNGLKGIYDAKVHVVYEEPGNYPGSRFLSSRIMRRDIVFGAEIMNDDYYGGENSWLSRDSFWRQMWSYDKDSFLYITTPESGTRCLKIRLGDDGIDVNTDTDPKLNTSNLAKMSCISGDPFWYEDDVVYPLVTKKDTRFTPSSTATKNPTETLTFVVDPADGKGGVNPTDQMIWLKWTVPASQLPAADAGSLAQSPYTQFTVPDYSFDNGPDAGRRIKTPGLINGEDCVIDTDPRVEQFTAANGSPVWSRTGGVRFVYPVPPWTKNDTFKVDVSGCAPGQMVTLRLPRPWSRPWGLEA